MKIVGKEQKAQRHPPAVPKADPRPQQPERTSDNSYVVKNIKLEVGTARQPAHLRMWVVQEIQGNEMDLEPTAIAYCTSHKQASLLVSKIGGYIA